MRTSTGCWWPASPSPHRIGGDPGACRYLDRRAAGGSGCASTPGVQPALDGGLLSATLIAQSDPHLIGRAPWWQRAAGFRSPVAASGVAGLPDQVSGLLPGLIDGDTFAARPGAGPSTSGWPGSRTWWRSVAPTARWPSERSYWCCAGPGRPRGCAVIGALVLVAFVLIARPSPSVLRAALMAAIALWCMATGRERVAVSALAATALALLGVAAATGQRRRLRDVGPGDRVAAADRARLGRRPAPPACPGRRRRSALLSPPRRTW